MPRPALLDPAQISQVVLDWKTSDARFSCALDTGTPQATALARLGIRLCTQDRYPDALLVLCAALALSPNDPNLLSNLAVVLERTNHTEEAILTVEKSLTLSQEQTDSPIDSQIDSYIFLGNLKSKQSDLPTLTGVDLSPRMLHHAQQRQLYDHLHCKELTQFLLRSLNQFDIIIAADVLIYFGNLTSLASALTQALRPNGLLLFSTETTDSPEHKLLPSGRFAHNPIHILSTFTKSFTPIHTQQTTLRLESTLSVPGNLFALQRREPAA